MADLPLISVITPTHDTTYLLEAWRSLAAQSYQGPWEWVLLPNAAHAAPEPVIPQEIRQDPRVRILELDRHDGQPAVGRLKRKAFSAARGDLLVEFDHDDLLPEGSLARLQAVAERDQAGFIYSDVASFQNDEAQTPYTYDGRFGWESYTVWLDRERVVTRSFPVTARSLCEIFYAPDHVRCWTRAAYDLAGGHDESLAVADDHDLICRTYLAGVKFAYTEVCGYLYRRHATNTSRVHNQQVQILQAQVRDKHFYPLVAEWCRREGLLALELEPNDYRLLGTLEADRYGSIKAHNDFLPRLTGDQATLAFSAIYRLLAPGGFFSIACPLGGGTMGFAPHYHSHWNMQSLAYYTEKSSAEQLPGNLARFQLVRGGVYHRTPQDANRRPWMYADLSALKGQRQPGLTQI